ncbi:lycopene cyclase family protein [Cecembia lonarensis]|uniref:Lycopene cyclase family protein n=1 Tax=Cecembia lonarensis (strain CCUG 58316 / KCTC 22772 / LW9) TaxID=1225176 RepID=K1L9I7_CECL9|nr:lycopene cyclase family protein [Cecembia lonarensis]EKB48862.1 lycopene cyclase family protein [Cecembia lonarensis LW9]
MQTPISTYDYIVTGFGCAGMSLLYHILNSELKEKNILVIDSSDKTENDRTWCYWSEKPLNIHPKNSPLIFWENIALSNGNQLVRKPLGNMKYFHIKSSDFYQEILEKIKQYPNIHFLKDTVIALEDHQDGGINAITKQSGTFFAEKAFNSIPETKDINSSPIILKQIFVGWKIKIQNDKFDKNTAVMMDFEEQNTSKTAFFYILPFSESEALLEYTVFSTDPVDMVVMEKQLENYILENLGESEYEITFREHGSIPMTTFEFGKPQSKNIIRLGTLAGCSKPSTGYTFHNIQKHCESIVHALENNLETNKLIWKRNGRFNFYDNILLNIAKKWPNALPTVFVNLFQVNSGPAVLSFLSEETNLFQELNLLIKLKFPIFIKSLIHYEKH